MNLPRNPDQYLPYLRPQNHFEELALFGTGAVIGSTVLLAASYMACKHIWQKFGPQSDQNQWYQE
jgi:hypothetical protein